VALVRGCRSGSSLYIYRVYYTVQLHPPAPKGGPTSSSADVSVPRPRTHDDRTGRVFPDHLITTDQGRPGNMFVSVRPGIMPRDGAERRSTAVGRGVRRKTPPA
jgi:hypothetical protein